MAYDVILDALGNATRRRICEALRAGPRAVGDLTGDLTGVLSVSRPAVSQHLKVLEAAGLVISTPEGTRRIYALRPEALTELRSYLDGFWTEVLAGYETEVKRRFGN
jgi:DNA-binding transcriptional ArsR family regulator